MKDYDLELKQVLWVEDDPVVIEQYPLKAENFDLQLVAYPCWDEAKVALENDFDRWSAIILDAKCKYHRDSEDNAVRFLGRALNDIALICEKRGRVIPWYVLTGGDAEEISDSINDDRMNGMLIGRIVLTKNTILRMLITKCCIDVSKFMQENPLESKYNKCIKRYLMQLKNVILMISVIMPLKICLSQFIFLTL